MAETAIDPRLLRLEAALDYLEAAGANIGFLVAFRRDLEQMQRDLAMLRRCLAEHHAVGVLDDVLIGDKCPVCARWLTHG